MAADQDRLTLLLADPLPARNETGCPALESLLARADADVFDATGFHARAMRLFGATIPTESDLPVAAVTRLADMGVLDREWWLRADPVHLIPERGGLFLQAGLGLTQVEANQLVDELSVVFSDRGWMLRAATPERWYLRPPQPPRIRTTPLAEAIGRDIHAVLPAGIEALAWHSLMNEAQIVLHASTVNATREAQGKPAANSLWFWGGGSLPGVQPSNWRTVFSNEPFTRGLATLAGIAPRAVPQTLSEVMSATTGETLVVLDRLPAADIESAWGAPLQAALRRGELALLSVMATGGPRYHCRPGQRWRFWRRRRPLGSYFSQP